MNKPIRIGFHTGPGGNPTGIGEHIAALDEAGRPAYVVAADVTVGLGDIYARWAMGSMVPHVTAFRVVRDGSEYYSVPNYDIDPYPAAVDFKDRIVPHIPTEVQAHKGRTWIVIGNELDKNRSDWLGDWATHIATLMNNEGYKVLLFGFSSGEPEPEHWQTRGMKRYLEYCAENADMAGVALHEYSLHLTDLLNGDGWLVGRYEKLYEACDLMGIGYPYVLVTEFGYHHNNLPSSSHHWETQNAALYERFPDYPGAALWYLGGDFDNIADKAQKYIQDATWRTLNEPIAGELAPVGNPDSGPGPDPEPCPTPCGAARVPYNRKVYRISELATKDQFLAAAEVAFNDNRASIVFSADDAAQGVGLGNVEIVEVGGQYSAPVIEDWYSAEYCIPEGNVSHIPFIDEGFGFSGYVWPVRPLSFNDWSTTDPWPGGWFSSNKFGNLYVNSSTGNISLHTGDDLNNNRPRWDADNGADTYAVAEGIVTFAGWRKVWGNIIVIRVDDPDLGPRWFRYSHLSRMDVETGYEVEKGMVVGTVGRDALGGPAHLHFDVAYVDTLETNPGDWPGLDMERLTQTYEDPTQFFLDADAEYLPPAGVPPVTYPVEFGIHASADARNAAGDMDRLITTNPELIKLLSSHEPGDVGQIANRFPFATYVIRAFLDFGGRNISPRQFYNDTVSDVSRTIDALAAQGVPDDQIWIELGNEPNLTTEGLGSSWDNAEEFSIWFGQLLEYYQDQFFGRFDIRFLFPGLSPGVAIDGLREHYHAYLDACTEEILNCDGLGVHSYWSQSFPIIGHPHSGVGPVDYAAGMFPSLPIIVTECSHNGHGVPPIEKAQSILSFWRECQKRPTVNGMAVFILSATNPAWNHANGSGEIITSSMAAEFASR